MRARSYQRDKYYYRTRRADWLYNDYDYGYGDSEMDRAADRALARATGKKGMDMYNSMAKTTIGKEEQV